MTLHLKILFIFIFLNVFLTSISADCSNCVNQCCLNNVCTDDVLVCGLSANTDFTALIASLALVAFFVIGRERILIKNNEIY